MVRSNVVEIEVAEIPPAPIISSVSLKADKTTATPGETVSFTATVEYTEPPTPEQARSYILVVTTYINDRKTETFTAPVTPEEKTADITFKITFEEPGKYRVYVDVTPQLKKPPAIPIH